uniref:Claudin n=1 Tax=Monopterus albus TaxID=43700 RepID=A0A3Q3JBE1_MONAL
MRRRLIQISGFVSSTLGWVLVLCTVAMDSWKTTRIGNQGGSAMMTVLWYWSNLWKDCVTDATSVSNCIDFPALWNVTYIINGVRGLLLTGLTLGLLGAILCLVGMECTYIGGTDKAKNKLLLAGAVFHFVGDISAYALYIIYLFDIFLPFNSRYNVGPPIFVGFAACIFIFVGALLYAVTVFQVICPERYLNHLSSFLSGYQCYTALLTLSMF